MGYWHLKEKEGRTRSGAKSEHSIWLKSNTSFWYFLQKVEMEGEMQENVEHVKQDIEETVEHQVSRPFVA